jgi:hypothetical protein
MAGHSEGTPPGPTSTSSPDDVEQRVRRLERRLAKARETEARRARKLERARRQGASETVRAARRRKLRKARERSGAIERKLARVRLAATPAAVALPVTTEPAAASEKPVAAETAAATSGPRAYCLRDRRTIVMVDPQATVMRNGRPALAGRCPSCGMRVVRPVRARPA